MVMKTYSPKDLQAILKISKVIFVFVVVVNVTLVLKVLTHRRIITSVVRKLRRYLPLNNFKPKSLFVPFNFSHVCLDKVSSTLNHPPRVDRR